MYENQPIGIVDRNGNMIHEGNRIRVVIGRGQYHQHTQECLVVFKDAAFQMLHDNGRTSYFTIHSNIDYEVL